MSNVGFPCLLLSSLNRPELTLGLVAHTFLAGALAVALFAVLGAVVLRLARQDVRRLLPSLMLPNTGNLGIPIAFFTFGKDGLIFAVAFSTLIQICHVTIGVWLASGEMTPRALLRNPMIYALVSALLLIGFEVKIPGAVQETLKLLGNIAVPLMLLMLGASLSRLRFASLPRSVLLSAVRVGGGFAIGLALASMLGMDHVAAGTFAIQCAMPVAVLSHMIAEKYNGPREEIAGMVLVSTMLALVALPGIISVTR
ncbi:AEC family transporter [Nocardia sp. CDC160]|uniref:AEC family transporter n=1 Tax=Nocardia sp. CDC160 TaxID=3112166 RepID=UPI002DB8B8D8|nr:AEC family transporter [Nocardia sp. CDC160]MEC3914808.1 AEC family transporter [Nocardia sp. CDC160]